VPAGVIKAYNKAKEVLASTGKKKAVVATTSITETPVAPIPSTVTPVAEEPAIPAENFVVSPESQLKLGELATALGVIPETATEKATAKTEEIPEGKPTGIVVEGEGEIVEGENKIQKFGGTPEYGLGNPFRNIVPALLFQV